MKMSKQAQRMLERSRKQVIKQGSKRTGYSKKSMRQALKGSK